jgi:hypothetical protein
MAKRQQVTKLLAVMAMAASPAMAGPEHDHHPDQHAPKAAAARPAPRPQRPAAATPAPAADPSGPAPGARRASAWPQPLFAVPGPTSLEVLLSMFGIARPRELPNARPAPGNVASRRPRRER